MALTITDPLDGPFLTARRLTDYRDTPGYAVPPGNLPAESLTAADRALARLDALRAGTRKAARG